MTSIAWSEYFTCIGAFSGRVQLRICRLRAYNSSAVPKRCDRGHFIFVTTKWNSISIHQATAGQRLARLQREGAERCCIRSLFQASLSLLHTALHYLNAWNRLLHSLLFSLPNGTRRPEKKRSLRFSYTMDNRKTFYYPWLYISRKVVEKECTRQSRKVIWDRSMGYDKYTVSDIVAV